MTRIAPFLKTDFFWLAGDKNARVQQRATGKVARELHFPATETSQVFCSELSEDKRDRQVFWGKPQVAQHNVYVYVEVFVDVYVYVYVAGKYTHKTLNRVLENMPAVSDLTSCR